MRKKKVKLYYTHTSSFFRISILNQQKKKENGEQRKMFVWKENEWKIEMNDNNRRRSWGKIMIKNYSPKKKETQQHKER